MPQKTVFPKASQSFQRVTSVTAEMWIPHCFLHWHNSDIAAQFSFALGVLCGFLGGSAILVWWGVPQRQGLICKTPPMNQVGKSLC